MTPAELNRGIEALRIKLKQLEHGQRIAYWHLMDLLDQGSPELSRALDGELHRLEATGELVFVEDEGGSESFVERRVEKKKVVKKKVAKKRPSTSLGRSGGKNVAKKKRPSTSLGRSGGKKVAKKKRPSTSRGRSGTK